MRVCVCVCAAMYAHFLILHINVQVPGIEGKIKKQYVSFIVCGLTCGNMYTCCEYVCYEDTYRLNPTHTHTTHTSARMHTHRCVRKCANAYTTHCDAQRRTATHCNALQRTATHVATFHHTAPHTNSCAHAHLHTSHSQQIYRA